jgi:hypothetical protein
MKDIKEEKEIIKKQPTLGKIIIEMKVRNIIDYLLSCFKRKQEKEHK